MNNLSRRRFLKLSAGATAASVLTPAIARAAAIEGNHRTRSIRDIEHIVVLMQENRSFDHYFGTMRGVRGFGDPHPATLPSGKSVFHQPDGASEVLPFHPDVPDAGLAFLEDLDHSWEGGHDVLDHGRYDQWVPIKSAPTMAHLTRSDIPFHYALADAFTLCDAYHCSLLGPTDPNRYYLWTGSCGGAGQGGGPVIANDELGYSWGTYPERTPARRRELEGVPGRRRRARQGRGRGAGRATRTSATTATTRCSTSPSTRTRIPATRFTTARASGRTRSRVRICSRCCVRTCGTTSCPPCRGSLHPRRTPSTRTGRPTTAPGTSHTSSTRSRPTRTCGARPRCC